MSLTLDELGMLNSWIAAKIRFEIADALGDKQNIGRYAREMQNAWNELAKAATDSNFKEQG